MKTFKNPITGETVKLAEMNCPGTFIIGDAIKACKTLGPGWRLPSKEELAIIYKLRLINFDVHSKEVYWSCSSLLGDYYAVEIKSGNEHKTNGDYEFSVRAVKTIN
jgi:hypothetical protein